MNSHVYYICNNIIDYAIMTKEDEGAFNLINIIMQP